MLEMMKCRMEDAEGWNFRYDPIFAMIAKFTMHSENLAPVFVI